METIPIKEEIKNKIELIRKLIKTEKTTFSFEEKNNNLLQNEISEIEYLVIEASLYENSPHYMQTIFHYLIASIRKYAYFGQYDEAEYTLDEIKEFLEL